MNADLQHNMSNMTSVKNTQTIIIVISTLLLLAQTAGAIGVTAVRTDKGKAVIEAELDASTALRVFVGQESPHWTTWVNEVTNLTATVAASSRIRLEDGSLGKGFLFSCGNGTHYVAITQDSPVPFGELTFRDNAKVSRSGGIFTFADIRKPDGSLVPVSVRALKLQRPATRALPQPGQSGMQGGSNLPSTTNATMRSWWAKVLTGNWRR
jgi:hypothetical protein